MFNFKQERLKKRIGKGNFGEVFPYQKTDKDFKWVVKRIEAEMKEVKNFDGEIDYDKTYQSLIHNILKWFPEIVIGFSIDHPCIVPVKGYFVEKSEDGYSVYMKLPRMKMSLEDEFKSRGGNKSDIKIYYEEAQLVRYFYSLALGVDYLHNKKIFHRDIKINNVLIDYDGCVKLSDVGSAKYVADDDFYHLLSGDHGAVNYKAPELIKYEEDFRKYQKNKDLSLLNSLLKKDSLFLIDAWSLGLTMLELCTLETRLVSPYKAPQEIEKELELVRKNIEESGLYRKDFLDLVFGLLSVDPTKRLKVSDVKSELEVRFPSISDEFRASFGLLDKNNQNEKAADDLKEIFKQESDKVLQQFERESQENRKKLDSFETRLIGLKYKLETLRFEKYQEMEELKSSYEETIDALRRDNLRLFRENERLNKNSQNVDFGTETFQAELEKQEEKLWTKEKLEQVMSIMQKQEGQFEIQEKGDAVLITSKRFDITDKELKDWMDDFIDNFNQAGVSTSLENLRIGLERCERITDTGVKSISEKIGHNFKNLADLRVCLSRCSQISDAGVKSLSENIAPNLKKLNRLELLFDNCKITDAGVKSLSENIAANLKNLSHLAFNFSFCDQITDEGVEIFSRNIAGSLKKLNYLDLDFTWCFKITDRGIKSLSEDIEANLQCLSSLKLNFNACDQITDTGVKNLSGKTGTTLKSLNHLELRLKGNKKVTDAGAKSLSERITTNLKNLKSLQLYLSNSSVNNSTKRTIELELKKSILCVVID